MLNAASYLFDCVERENPALRLVPDWGEYTMEKLWADNACEELGKRLSKEDAALLDQYCDHHTAVEALEREALFTAGLALGASLPRL